MVKLIINLLGIYQLLGGQVVMEDKNELRQRRPSASNDSNITHPSKKKVEVNTGEQVEKYVIGLADKIPQKFIQYKPYVLKSAPIFKEIVNGFIKLIPYFVLAYQKFEELRIKLQPYKIHLLLPSFGGLIMCFFGGTFVTLIAAVEAFRMSSYQSTLECVKSLWEDFKQLEEVNKEDDAKDDDGDGIPDVLQISNETLMKRKLLLFLRTVDPKRVSKAITGINTGFLAVAATLKLEFAKVFTLQQQCGIA